MTETTAGTAIGGRAGTRLDLYTDGACSGNPGPGGWGVLIRRGPDEESAAARRRRPTTAWNCRPPSRR